MTDQLRSEIAALLARLRECGVPESEIQAVVDRAVARGILRGVERAKLARRFGKVADA